MRHTARSLLVALMLAVSLATSGLAGPYEDGVAAYDRRDYATAVRLWRLLAENGDADAQTLLGIMYAEGKGVPQDDVEAMKWYRLAAEQGDASAQFNLGLLYADGQGVPQNNAEAAKWYRFAAERGQANAQGNLGFMYLNGLGVPQDNVMAHMWFNLAAAQGNENATENRDVAASRMTPADISEAQRLARQWKPTRN